MLRTLLLLPLACALVSDTVEVEHVEPQAIDFHEHADTYGREHDEKHDHDSDKEEDSKDSAVQKSQHWWSRFWPFVLPGTPMRSDVADAVQLDERHEHGKDGKDEGSVSHGSAPSHWWDHLWPFATSGQDVSQNSQLLADEQDLGYLDQFWRDIYLALVVTNILFFSMCFAFRSSISSRVGQGCHCSSIFIRLSSIVHSLFIHFASIFHP